MLSSKRCHVGRFFFGAAFCFFCSGITVPVSAQEKMYFSVWGNEPRTIRRADFDGMNTETVFAGTTGSAPDALALDIPSRKIYWSDPARLEIRRATLLGQNVEVLVTGVRSWGIAVDPAHDVMYWSTDIADVFASGIYSSSLDGGNPTLIVPADGRATKGIALDTVHGKLYWGVANGQPRLIRRANLDGTAVETVVEFPGIPAPVTLAVDALGDHIYWSAIDIANGLSEPWVGRSRLDGSEIEVLYQPVDPIEADGIALDLPRGHVYWTSRDQTIQRSNLDGTNRVVMNLGINGLRSIAIDTRPAVKIPAASTWGMVALTLAIGVAGTILLLRRRFG